MICLKTSLMAAVQKNAQQQRELGSPEGDQYGGMDGMDSPKRKRSSYKNAPTKMAFQQRTTASLDKLLHGQARAAYQPQQKKGQPKSCTCTIALEPYVHRYREMKSTKRNREKFLMKLKKPEKGGRDIKRMNALLLEILFDSHGNYLYHSKCIKDMFEVSSARLARLRTQKKMMAAGEGDKIVTHKLKGRRSNRAMKPETREQFREFIMANRRPVGSRHGSPIYYLDPRYSCLSAKDEQVGHTSSVRYEFNKFQMLRSPQGEILSDNTFKRWFKEDFRLDTTIDPKSRGTCPSKDPSMPLHRPYICDFPGCTKGYASKAALKVHARAHTGEKPFACGFPGCGKRFQSAFTRRRHEQAHALSLGHKIKP
eukprot:GILJ01002523.1.p1 GENE.GILJ01002523.1~~GILJ01002523.1.p1  ORF type:complete len:427 (+),score=54.91 GILJ01002523.1:180-1283(+)